MIADKNGISLTQFITWNNVGGASCPGLQANVNVCVSIIGHTATITTTTRPATTTAPSNGIQTPQPTQPGMVGNCDAFYFVQPGDGCQKIADKSGISLAQLISWNDVGGASCGGLQANVNVCVSIIGVSPTFVSTTPTSTCATAAPTPTQPGAVCRCKTWHQVRENQFCGDIEALYRITAAQFNAWNPQVGADCRLLFLGYYVCVGV
jgi:LysM repeat protein